MNKNKTKIIKHISKSSYMKNEFWSLEGSLKSHIELSGEMLKLARKSFSKNWAKND